MPVRQRYGFHICKAYEDLGAEALRKLYVEDMPLFVIIDCEGNNLYDEGRKAYLDTQDK